MYLIHWNQAINRIEASLGGRITTTEAKVFTDELVEMLRTLGTDEFSFMLDYSTASALEPGAADVLQRAQSYCLLHGARKLTFVARDQEEAELMIGQRLQQVLEGTEEYITYEMAA